MKTRPEGFLKKYYDERSADDEVASYIKELHDYLWRFVRAELPFASGSLQQYLDVAIESAEHTKDSSK